MKVIGVGAGPGMLTLEAIEAIKSAIMIYGSERSIELARPYIQPACDVRVIEDYRELARLPEGATVLSTGDPMLSGLGYLGGEIVPGISSMQVACARLGISQLRMIPITFHGRKMNPEAVAFELARGMTVFLLTDSGTDIVGLCRFLEERGLKKDVAVLTDLGYPEESISIGETSSGLEAPGLSCVVIGEIPEYRKAFYRKGTSIL